MRRTTAAVAATLLALGLLAACGADGPVEAEDPAPSSPTATTSESEPTSPAASDVPPTSSTEGGPQTVSAMLFFAGDAPLGPRLFAETQAVEADNPLEEAAAILVADAPIDPDYRSLLEGAPIESVSYDEGDEAITVGLADDGWSTPPPGMSRADARLAVQQLVYTLQAVAGGEGKPVSAPVEFVLGEQETTFLGASGAVEAARELSVRGLVNILRPADGAILNAGQPFTAEGMSSSFEATVVWEVHDSSGAVVVEGSATAEGWFRRLYPWTAEIDVSSLEPGEYTFVARTDDPTGGAEGPGPTEDTKAFVIE